MKQTLITVTLVVGLAVPAFAAVEPAKPVLAPSDPNPTPITIHVKDATVADAVAQIAQQSGFAIDAAQLAAGGRKVTLDADNAAFWNVMLQLCDSTDAALEVSPTGQFLLSPRNAGGAVGLLSSFVAGARPRAKTSLSSGPRAVSGPFLLLPAATTSTIDYTTGADGQSQARIELKVVPEPRLRLFPAGPAAPPPTQAADEKGNSLVGVVGMSPPRQIPWMYNASGGTTAIPLSLPPGAGHKLASVRGELPLSLVAETTSVEFADPIRPQPVKTTAAGMNITLQPIRKTGGGASAQYQVSVQFARGTLDAEQWHAMQAMWAGNASRESVVRPRFVDAEGAAAGTLLFAGSGAAGPDSVIVYFYTQIARVTQPGGDAATAQPAKLVIEMPAATVRVIASYEFRDLPLP